MTRNNKLTGNGQDWYRYVSRQFNNLLLDPAGAEIYDKYFQLGLSKLYNHLPLAAGALEGVYNIHKKRREL
jgi:hypothetical protein